MLVSGGVVVGGDLTIGVKLLRNLLSESTKVPKARTGCPGKKSRNEVSSGRKRAIIRFTPLILTLFSSNNVYISHFRAQISPFWIDLVSYPPYLAREG